MCLSSKMRRFLPPADYFEKNNTYLQSVTFIEEQKHTVAEE